MYKYKSYINVRLILLNMYNTSAMNIQENKKCVAVIQMRSTLNKSNNLAQSKMLIEKAKNNNVKVYV